MKKQLKSVIASSILCGMALFIFACNDVEDGPVDIIGTETEDVGIGIVQEGLVNGNMEQENAILLNMPNGWRNLVAFFEAPNNYTFSHSSTATEGDFSLMIDNKEVDSNDEYPYAQQVIINPQIPFGSTVRLTAKVKSENLSGGGFEIILLTPDDRSQAFIPLGSSLPSSRFSGSRDWTEYEAVIPSYPSNVTELYVWIRLLPQTAGRIYVDDLNLTYEIQ